MPMSGGFVSITQNADGTPIYAGSGMALALAQARVNARLAAFRAQNGYDLVPVPAVGSAAFPFSTQSPATRDLLAHHIQMAAALFSSSVADANADGPAIVTYLQANAVAHGSSSGSDDIPIT